MSLIASSVVAIAQVEPLTTTRRLSGPFDYALPAEPLEVGSVVRVPFGHQRLDGRRGRARRTASELPPERLVAPSAVREDSVPPDLVELALWMADGVRLDAGPRALARAAAAGQAAHARCGRGATDAPLDGERLTARQRALLDRLPGAGGRRPRLAAAPGGARARRARSRARSAASR